PQRVRVGELAARATAVERGRVPGRGEEVELEGAEDGIDGCAGIEQREHLVHERVDLAPRFAAEHHAVDELEDVAAGRVPIEVTRVRAPDAEKLAAHEEGEVGGGPLAEHDADADEGLERAREAAARVLRPLRDPGDLP